MEESRKEKQSIRILVIDDEMGMRDFLKYELGFNGYSVSTATNGMEALEITNRENFDLVICDMKMPQKDGLDTLEAIKKVNPDIEVIMITGFATIEDAMAAMKKGAYDFIQKPFTLDELNALIQRALEKGELKALTGVYESSKAIFSSSKKEPLLSLIVELSSKVLRADEVYIFLMGQDGKLEMGAASIPIDRPQGQLILELGKRRLKKALFQGKEPKLISTFSKNDLPFSDPPNSMDIKSMITYPLVIKGEVIGLLMANRTVKTDPFNISEFRNATIFSSQAAQAIYSAKIHQELEVKVHELKNSNQCLKKMQDQLIKTEKLAAVGLLAAGVAHELNNPLTGILGFSQMILEDGGFKEENREDLEGIIREAKRCRQIIQNLLKFSRKVEPTKQPIDIVSLLDATLDMVQYDFSSSANEIVKQFSLPLSPVLGDPSQLQQVFINIFTNAKHAMAGKRSGRLVIQGFEQDKKIVLRFKDNGCGIPRDTINKIFDPFFTSKPAGKGTGLGLSLSYGIIQEHGGSISVESQTGRGTTFIINLPTFNSVSNG